MINEKLFISAGAGIIALSVYVAFAVKTGIIFWILNEDGTYRKKTPLKGSILGLSMLLGVCLFLVLSDYYIYSMDDVKVTFFELFALNSICITILFVWDTFILDILVIAIWRPKFLNLPDAITLESMKKHAATSITIGIIPLLIITLLGTSIYYFGIPV